MKKFLFLILLCLPGLATAQIILVIGDSLSAAYGIPIEKGWVTLMQTRLTEKGFNYKVVNASISGDTTANARDRLKPLLQQHKPAIVIVQLGGNDGLRGLSLKAMKANLETMIRDIKFSPATVVLVGVQLPPNYGKPYTKKFESIYPEIVEKYGVILVSSIVEGIGDNPRLMQADGIHPNEKAQSVILEKIWPEVEELLHKG